MIKIVFVDMSRTLVKGSGSNAGAEFLGKGELYKQIYPEYSSGKKSIEELLKQTFSCWKGLRISDLPQVYKKFEFNEGAKETINVIHKKGIKIALLTNIPTHLSELFKKELKLDFITGTTLEVKNGVFTGKVLEYHNNKVAEAKKILTNANVLPEYAIHIGDTKEDAVVFKKLKFGISYNGDNQTNKAAKYKISKFTEILKILEKESK